MSEMAVTSADEAARYLDANVTRQPNWFGGFGTNRFCKIPFFSIHFRDLQTAWTEAISLEQHFLAVAIAEANLLRETGRPNWCQGSFSRPQLDAALDSTAMRFDKAIVAVRALNQVAVKLERTPPFVDHCIVTCGFRFERLDELISTASGEYQSKVGASKNLNTIQCRQRVIRYLADTSGQPFGVVRDLASVEGRTKFTASYPTHRAIFKAIMKFDSCQETVGDVERSELIKLRKRGDSQMSAVENEKLLDPQQVTRPPYHWVDRESTDGGKKAFPPEVSPPDPFTWEPSS